MTSCQSEDSAISASHLGANLFRQKKCRLLFIRYSYNFYGWLYTWWTTRIPNYMFSNNFLHKIWNIAQPLKSAFLAPNSTIEKSDKGLIQDNHKLDASGDVSIGAGSGIGSCFNNGNKKVRSAFAFNEEYLFYQAFLILLVSVSISPHLSQCFSKRGIV